MEFQHIPVLLEECLDALHIRPGGVYVDGTAGGAGHSVEIARRLKEGRLVAVDKDETALRVAAQRLAPYPQARVVRGDFRDLPPLLEEQGVSRVDGILLDLGVSSHQLDTPERGFSYMHDAPLDMRMASQGLSAREIVNGWSGNELVRIFREYGEEKFAGRIARGILQAREHKPVETTGQLVAIIDRAVPAAARRSGGHTAKRVFQALRIAANGELESLSQCLEEGFRLLNPGGRFAIITFHSLEDRMVKLAFREFCKGCVCPPEFPICVCGRKPAARLVYKKPVTPSGPEQERNSRSRSAKLRALEKIGEHQ